VPLSDTVAMDFASGGNRDGTGSLNGFFSRFIL
jgi:hypothetical protein